MVSGHEYTTRDVIVTESPESVAKTAADLLLKTALESVKRSGIFSIALSGGNTPKALYQLLSDSRHSYRNSVPWEKVHFFWGDERHVLSGHPENNYRMVEESLLSKIDVPPENIHFIHTEENTPQAVALKYENELKEFFRPGKGEIPSFDLVLLGMGGDGHTASIFPGSPILKEKERLVMTDPTPRLNHRRVSLTPAVLNNASLVVFLVSGREKAERVKEIIENPEAEYPAGLISPVRGKLVWIIDRAAGHLLSSAVKRVNTRR